MPHTLGSIFSNSNSTDDGLGNDNDFMLSFSLTDSQEEEKISAHSINKLSPWIDWDDDEDEIYLILERKNKLDLIIDLRTFATSKYCPDSQRVNFFMFIKEVEPTPLEHLSLMMELGYRLMYITHSSDEKNHKKNYEKNKNRLSTIVLKSMQSPQTEKAAGIGLVVMGNIFWAASIALMITTAGVATPLSLLLASFGSFFLCLGVQLISQASRKTPTYSKVFPLVKRFFSPSELIALLPAKSHSRQLSRK